MPSITATWSEERRARPLSVFSATASETFSKKNTNKSVADRMAGARAIGLGVTELTNESITFARMAEVAAELRDEDGADVLIMGCAGMARYRDRLQRHVGLPVVEPSQAAVSMAIGRTRLGWS